MIQIPIQSIPNQSLSLQLDNNLYDINIQSTIDNPDGSSGICAIDISINNVVIVTGVRAVAGYPIIASLYQQNGNFQFVTMNDEYPDWRQFGVTQYFIYISQDELNIIYGTE